VENTVSLRYFRIVRYPHVMRKKKVLTLSFSHISPPAYACRRSLHMTRRKPDGEAAADLLTDVTTAPQAADSAAEPGPEK
jgi:hypothetical protein